MLQKVVILHVKLKDNMQAFTHTFDSSDWAKSQNQLIQKVVVLHFKMKGIMSRKNATGVLKTRNNDMNNTVKCQIGFYFFCI